MKKIILFFTLSLFYSITIHAQSAMVQKAGKTVFSLTTFNADGTIRATSHGVFAGESCEGISSFTPFIGASSAVVIDAAGRKYDVEAIIGANEIYDICRFRLSGGSLPIAVAQKQAKDKVFAISYSVKRPSATPLTIKSAEKFMDKYFYYIFNEEITEELEGCPIVNADGEMIGLAQRANTNYDVHSTDGRYYSELVSSGLSLNNPVFKKTGIRPALPTDKNEARLMLMMLDASADSMNVVGAVDDFNRLFPGEMDGYSALSSYQLVHGNLDAASRTMEQAIRAVNAPEEAYAEYAKHIYSVAIYTPDSVVCPWTLDLAEENISRAIALSPQPAYKHQLGQIHFAKGDYQSAFGIFEDISQNGMSTSDVFYEMAQCKSFLGADNTEILTYLDKSVEACPKPLTQMSAPYYYTRGVTLDAMGEYKKAMQDYNMYDTLMLFRATPEFYYTRYKCETKLRQYQQALNDIAHAVVLDPREVTYYAEMGSLQLRVGQYENALKTCDMSKYVTTDNNDIYIIEGVANMQLGKKDEARTAFLKARELGDERAEDYLNKLK